MNSWSYLGLQKATSVVAILAAPHHVLFIRSASLARRRLGCNSLKSVITGSFGSKNRVSSSDIYKASVYYIKNDASVKYHWAICSPTNNIPLNRFAFWYPY